MLGVKRHLGFLQEPSGIAQKPRLKLGHLHPRLVEPISRDGDGRRHERTGKHGRFAAGARQVPREDIGETQPRPLPGQVDGQPAVQPPGRAQADQEHEREHGGVGPRPAEAEPAADERRGDSQPGHHHHGENPGQARARPALGVELAGPVRPGRDQGREQSQGQPAQVLAKPRGGRFRRVDVLADRWRRRFHGRLLRRRRTHGNRRSGATPRHSLTPLCLRPAPGSPPRPASSTSGP